MPNHQAATPHTMMATMAAISAVSAWWESPPKFTMEKTVWATAVETSDTSRRPKKLKIAAIMMA